MTGSPLVWTLIASMMVFDLIGLFYLWRRRQSQEAHSGRERNGEDAVISLPTLDRRRSERRSNSPSPAVQKHLPPRPIRKKTGT